MPDVTVRVNAGVCQFDTVVTASMDENMDITYKIKSACPSVRNMAKELGAIPVFEVIAMPFTENPVYKACSCLEHVSCPVPCIMIKAGEAAGELALKKDVTVNFE